MKFLGQSLKTLLCKLIRDESGGETLEYSLVGGLMVVTALGMLKGVGTKVLARWTSLNSSL